MEKPTLVVCLPGSEFSHSFLGAWTNLYAHLLRTFRVVHITMACSNQYTVRDKIVATVKAGNWGAKYWLWIDSDNLLQPEGFDLLYQTLEMNPGVAGVGGWYLIDVEPPVVCAAKANNDFTKVESFTLEEIKKAFLEKEILEVTGHMGFGSFLVRSEVMENAGEYAFSPIVREDGMYCGDDVSFFRRQIKSGYRFFLHPGVYLPHLKLKEVGTMELMKVFGSAEMEKEEVSRVAV